MNFGLMGCRECFRSITKEIRFVKTLQYVLDYGDEMKIPIVKDMIRVLQQDAISKNEFIGMI